MENIRLKYGQHYSSFVLVWWIFNPELRRLVDWRIGFSSISIISIVPLVLLAPFAFDLVFLNQWKRLPFVLRIAVWIWLGAFGYSYFISIITLDVLPGAFTLANFLFPMSLGLWLATRSEISPDQSLEHIYRLLFWSATVLGVYGIIQYVFVPPWDADWMINSGLRSIGKPAPFQVRVFSALNSPNVFGNYMFVALAVVIPKLTPKPKLSLLIQVAIWLAAFALSQDRSAWLAVGVAFVVFLLLSPTRLLALGGAVLFVGVATAMTLSLSTITGSSNATKNFVTRISSLQDPSQDVSALDRERQYGEASSDFRENILGQGLGITSVATKLSNKGTTTSLDTGIFSRYLEMGIFGGTLFFMGLLVPVVAGVDALIRAKALGERQLAARISMAIGVLLAALSLEISGDFQAGLIGILTWIFNAYLIRAATQLSTPSNKFSGITFDPIRQM